MTDRLLLLAFRLGRWLVPRLPLRVTYGLATLVADLMWLLIPQVRGRIAHNQRRALGPGATEREVALSTRSALRHLTKLYVDEFRYPAMSGEELRDLVDFHGLENLDEARTHGRGVILASIHYGAPQIVGQLLAVLGYPTTVVVEHVRPEALFQLVTRWRESHGLRLIPIDQPLIGLIRTLRKENGVVGLVVDRDVTGTGIRLPFLGEETRVADGAVQLALRTGAPLVIAHCRRTEDGRYEAWVQPPLPLPERPSDPEAAIREGTVALKERLEAIIRQEPGQWIMTVPLWADENGQ